MNERAESTKFMITSLMQRKWELNSFSTTHYIKRRVWIVKKRDTLFIQLMFRNSVLRYCFNYKAARDSLASAVYVRIIFQLIVTLGIFFPCCSKLRESSFVHFQDLFYIWIIQKKLNVLKYPSMSTAALSRIHSLIISM